MTVEEAIREVYATTDEQDDLSPFTAGVFDLASAGAVSVLGALRRGAQAVSTWRFPDGERPFFRTLERVANIVLTPHRGVVSDWQSPNVDIEGIPLESYVGKLVVFYDAQGNAVHSSIIASSVVVGAAVRAALLSLPSASVDLDLLDCVVTSNEWVFEEIGATGPFAFVLPGRVIDLLGIDDIGARVELEPLDRHALSLDAPYESGAPTAFRKIGRGVSFDRCPVDSVTLRVRYAAYPLMGATASEELCDLQEAFHEPIVQWARHWAFSRAGDSLAAADAWALVEKYVYSIRNALEIESDFTDSALVVEA